MTLHDYAAGWFADHGGRLKPHAVRAYRSALMHHVLPALGTNDLASLTTPQIRAWLQCQLTAGRPRGSVKAALGALSTVLMDAVLEGLVVTNVAHGASRRLWPPGGTRDTPKALTTAELEALLAESRRLGSHWACDGFTLAARTGLRLGEVLALQAAHVQLEDATLRIEQTYHGGALGFGSPKNGKPRLVELSPQTIELLARRIDQAQPPRCYLFASPEQPDRPIHPSTVEWAFNRAASIAQLATHYTFHSLRHTYASTLLAAGAPPQFVQQQLGHSNYGITVDLYGSWFYSRHPDFVALLDHEPPTPPPQLARPRAPGVPSSGKVIPFPAARRVAAVSADTAASPPEQKSPTDAKRGP
jgi:integrase